MARTILRQTGMRPSVTALKSQGWLLVLVAGAAAVIACGESSTGVTIGDDADAAQVAESPTPKVTPAISELGALLRRIDEAMASVRTGRSMVEVDATIEYSDSEERYSSTSVGDFQAPDRSQYVTVVDGGGFSLETETISVGRSSWTRVTSFVESPWEPDSEGPAGSVLTLGLFDMRFGPETEEHFELLGEETLEGEAVFRLKGGAGAVRLPNVTSATDLASREMEYWVGASDFLVRKAVLRSEASFAVPTFSDQLVRETVRQTSGIVVTLSDYGKAVDIQEPNATAGEESP